MLLRKLRVLPPCLQGNGSRARFAVHQFALPRNRWTSGIGLAPRSAVDVGVFWDTASVALPQGLGLPARVSNAVRQALGQYGLLVERRVYFQSLAEGSSPADLASSGFTLVHCPSSANGAAIDLRLGVDVMHFAWQRACAGRPAVVGLITGDAGHAYLLSKVRDLGVRVVLVHPGEANTQGSLSAAADVSISWQADIMSGIMTDSSWTHHARKAGEGTPEFPLPTSPHTAPCLKVDAEFLQSYQSNSLLDSQTHSFVLPDAGVIASFPAVSGKLKSWGELDADERQGAAVLGYDAAAWDDGSRMPSQSTRTWKDLTNEERNAVLLLGYSAAEWDSELGALVASSAFPVHASAASSAASYNGSLIGRIEGGRAETVECLGGLGSPQRTHSVHAFGEGADRAELEFAFSKAFRQSLGAAPASSYGSFPSSALPTDRDESGTVEDAFSDDIELGLVRR